MTTAWSNKMERVRKKEKERERERVREQQIKKKMFQENKEGVNSI